MLSNFDHSFELLLKSEGGYSANKNDPGGTTNLGVTQAVWSNWVGHIASDKEMRNLIPPMVKPLYKKKYWDACNCDSLPIGIDYLVFDFAVNAGVGRSCKTFQSSLNVTSDGSIGSQTLNAIVNKPKIALIKDFSDAKEAFYRSLPTFNVFGQGWLNRIDFAKSAALSMVE